MVARRLSLAVIFIAPLIATLFAAPAQAQEQGQGQTTLLGTFGHNDALDGTPNEIVSGKGGDDPSADPLTSRPANSYETFPLVVPPGSQYGGLVATVRWQDPRLDFDIYLYRQRSDGTLVPGAIAQSAGFGTPSETATYRPPLSGEPVAAGTYVLVVDNWCTRNADPLAQPGGCDIENAAGAPVEIADEDDFIGTFESIAPLPANPLPRVSLAGPDAVKTTDVVSFTATATDDGAVREYAFDLDGDGRFEYDNAQNPTISHRFQTPGTINVGVRVTDDEGGQSFANRRLTVSAPPVPVAVVPLLERFTLGRPSFGGVRARSLVVHYRLSAQATVDLALYRGTRRVRTLARGVRGATRTPRVAIRSRGLARGMYNVRLSARTADGRTQTLRLSSRRL
jgi:hypothetical protein